jgi:hypothetical protein
LDSRWIPGGVHMSPCGVHMDFVQNCGLGSFSDGLHLDSIWNLWGRVNYTEEGEENWGQGKKQVFILFLSVLSFLTPPPLAVERHWLIANMKTRLRMPRALLLVSSCVYSNSS